MSGSARLLGAARLGPRKQPARPPGLARPHPSAVTLQAEKKQFRRPRRLLASAGRPGLAGLRRALACVSGLGPGWMHVPAPAPAPLGARVFFPNR